MSHNPDKDVFNNEYKKLNIAQKDAVDTIDGPVMVVAGPGTGKTQVLALRIANIIDKTDTPPNGILALTFTRSGVSAMRQRLEKYVGNISRDVTINTFHSFAGNIVEKYYEVLGFDYSPKLIDEKETVFLVDEILNSHDWQYLKSRSNNAQYFNDLKSLISLLKKERITPEEFQVLIDVEIKDLENDPENISSRGESRGQLKQAIVTKINSYNRTLEAVKFYKIYEDLKKERNLMDYDDVLEYALQIVKESSDAQSDIKEEYLYILIDEHQDSSFVQNNFLKAVWQEVELPNIFVVGDDRQLIYGFSGANINYFEEFSHIFGKAKLITLVENYRSTGNILNLADDLLKSSITKDSLKTNTKINKEINLLEYNYPRDEIIGIALNIKDHIANGASPEDFAILVPKNKHVKAVAQVLSDMNIPVTSEKNVSLFNLAEFESIISVINLINNPFNSIFISKLLLDKVSGIDSYTAQKFLKDFKKPDNLTIDDLINLSVNENLFESVNPVSNWGKTLKRYSVDLYNEKISHIVSFVGNELLIEKSQNHDELLKNVEIVRTFIHLAQSFEEKNPSGKIVDFISYLERLSSYDTNISLALIGKLDGVNVMTLHRSKGLEYKHVFVAHMNQEILMSSKKNAFSLPEKINNLIEKKDTETAKRELYVAITRGKEFLTITYAKEKLEGGDLTLANIIKDLDPKHFTIKNSIENENAIINSGINNFALKPKLVQDNLEMGNVISFVKDRFPETRISVSMLNNFFECSWKWYFRNFLKLPETKSNSLSLGSAVHNALEYIIKENKLPPVTVIENKIKESLQKDGVLDLKELSKLTKEGLSITTDWIKNYYPNLSADRIAERDISFRDPQFPNLTMYGKIDLTERYSEGEIIVTDFKTGKSKTKNEIEKLNEEERLSSYMRQLAMYSYLIRGAEHGKIVTNSRLLFLESNSKDKNAVYSTNITNEHVDLLIRDIADYNNLLNSGDWVTRPCNTKNYGTNNVCQYCALSIKIFN